MEYLTCRVRGDRYGLPLRQVREIVGTAPITRVPGAAPALRGLAGHRGNPLPVLDLAVRLGFPETAVGGRSCLVLVEAPCDGTPILVGMLVDGVDRIASVDRDRGALPPSLERLAIEGVCTGFGEVDGQLVPLLDPEALLRLEALRRVRPSAVAPRPAAGEGKTRRPGPPPPAAEAPAPPFPEAPAPGVPEASPPSLRPPSPAGAAGRETGGPPRDLSTRGGPAKRDQPRAAGGERPLRREEAARRSVEAPRVPAGAAASRPAPRASALSGPGSGTWAPPLAPAASREAPLATATQDGPAARISNARWKPGVLAAAAAVALLVAGALAVLGWRDLGGSGMGSAPAAGPPRSEASAALPPGPPAGPGPAVEKLPAVAPAPAAVKPPAAGMASGAAAAEPPRAGAGPARQGVPAVAPRPRGARRSEPPPPAPGKPGGDDWIYEVRPGDSLWRLSSRYLGDPERWPAIFERNRDQIADPDLIEPHQRLVVPAEASQEPRR